MGAMGSLWRLWVVRGSEATFLAGLQALLAHEPADPVGTAVHLLAPQALADAPAAVRAATLAEQCPDLLG